jgi:hypothetical protein
MVERKTDSQLTTSQPGALELPRSNEFILKLAVANQFGLVDKRSADQITALVLEDPERVQMALAFSYRYPQYMKQNPTEQMSREIQGIQETFPGVIDRFPDPEFAPILDNNPEMAKHIIE